MKKRILITLLTILSLNCYSQIIFEKGYFINNANEKTACLIKNNDWRSNPISFEYKLSETDKVQNGLLEWVKEFGVYDAFKYVRSATKIDRSSNNINSLSTTAEPVFSEETLYLKVVLEGKSSLYEYVDSSITRFFYSIDNNDKEQLIYKRYISTGTIIEKNNKFRQQLWTNLKCPEIELSEVLALDYKKKDLVKFFTKYNTCNNSEVVLIERQKSNQNLFHLTLRPRFNSNSLSIQNISAPNWQIDFDAQSGFGMGLEAELVLPYYKNKWSIILEPTYQTFSSKGSNTVPGISGGKLLATIEYKSIEIPIGIRYSFYLSDKSKLFIDGAVVFDFSSNSSLLLTRVDGSVLETLDLDKSNNLAFGAGYRYNNKYSIAAKFQTSRNILGNYVAWEAHYNSFSLLLGYTIF